MDKPKTTNISLLAEPGDGFLARVTRRLAPFAEARPLMWLGALGLVLAGVCAAVAAVHGTAIAPEGDLMKAITFDGAVGIYLLTIALFVPLARFSRKGRRWWFGWMIGLTLYAYGIETIQTLRGLDPRFSRVGSQSDQLAGLVFFLVALGLIITFIILAVKLARRRAAGAEGLVLLAIRYASIATMIAFAAGLWMGARQGRMTGVAGNILPLHAIGFHGLQAIPLVALLFGRSAVPYKDARRWVHAAGVAWIGMCLAIAWQTAAGRPVTELSPPMLLASAVMLAWMLSALAAAQAWRRSALHPTVREKL